MKDRIRQLMESQHMPQKSFANFIGISEGTLSGIFNERTRPSLQTVEAIKNKIPTLNTDWLIFGRGPMYMDESSAADAPGNAPAKEPTLEFAPPSSTPFSSGQEANYGRRVVNTPNNQQKFDLNYFDKMPRKIAHITVYYDDQTWETFVPKKM